MISIKTESARTQRSDHEQSGDNTHILEEVLGLVSSISAIRHFPKIVHINADRNRQQGQNQRRPLALET